MSEDTKSTIRLSKAAKEFNVGMGTILDFLAKKGFQVDSSPNTKLTAEMYALLVKEYQGEREVKNEAKKLGDLSYKGGSVSVDSTIQTTADEREEEDTEVFIRSTTISTKPVKEEKASRRESAPVESSEPVKPTEPISQPEEDHQVEGASIKVVGKIDLDSLNAKTRPEKKKSTKQAETKKTETKKSEPKKAEEKKVDEKKTILIEG